MPEKSSDDSSYPPLFRRPNNPNADHRAPPPVCPDLHPTVDLPLMDLENLDSRALGEACRDWGFFRLANHGIPKTLSGRLQEEARRLLSLPFESKRTRFSHPVTYFWGTPALTRSVRNLNWVEGLHALLGQLQSGGGDPDPDDFSSFRCLVEEYGGHSARITRRLFEALATEELKLDSERSASYLSESDGMMRIHRYPCCPVSDEYSGMDAHTDSSVLSIVNQDEVGGLQVLRDQRWFDVKPIPDTLIVNIGDMMQAISNDEYKSVEHRVLANGSEERISICYFAFPKEDVVITSSKYKEFTYKEFKAKVLEDTKAVGFKVGLERLKMGDPS